MCRQKLLLLGILLSLLTSGCAVFGGAPPREGGSGLSEAAREASKSDDEKKKIVHTGDPVPETVVVVDTPVEGLTPTSETMDVTSATPTTGSRFPWHFGAIVAGGTLASDQLDGFGGGGVQIGGYLGPRIRADLNLLALPVNLAERSSLRGSLKNEVQLVADFSGRYYLTPEYTAFGVYPMAGFRFGTLMWDYANPIVVDDGGELVTLKDDELYFYEPYIGFGVSVLQSRHLHMGVNLTSGLRIYDPHTQAGFRNDEFGTEGYYQLMVELTGMF